jgi:chemotaxis protein methyltransferase CheR
MLLQDSMPNATTRVSITATDLSREMVARTKAGRFSQLEVNRGLPAPMLVRHFTRAGNEWEVAPGLRRMVTASECNLAGPLPRMGPFDVVYLRNVLIYFDLPTKQAILRRVRELMRPDGWLFLGAAETTLGVDDSWERVVVGRSSAYRPLKGK